MTRKAKFYLYRNLRTGGFSIKQHGLVCDRSDFVTMRNVEFRVSEPGRLRAVNEQQRNVHAYMVADNYLLPKNLMWQQGKMVQVTYNPFENDTFVDAKTGEPIRSAKYAIARKGRVWVSDPA
jgi:hypothetical protein